MASTRDLDPRFKPIADALIAALREIDPRYVITSARRSSTAQAQLYARYRRGEPGVFTVAIPGTSAHERGLAVDIARIGLHPMSDPLLHAVGTWWRGVGGVWGGTKDPVHFGI